jgi:hypothetical protein
LIGFPYAELMVPSKDSVFIRYLWAMLMQPTCQVAEVESGRNTHNHNSGL